MSIVDDTATLRLPASTTARFVGDVHLGDGARNDIFQSKDALLVRFLRDCKQSSDAVVFMGDAIDLAQGWTTRRILAAHPEVVRTIEALSRQMRVIFVCGNHDWKVDYEAIFPAAQMCEQILLGDMLAWHGHRLDRICDVERPGYLARIAVHPLVERLFGFEFRIPLHEHDTWQNRVAHWLGFQHARFLRKQAALCRVLGLDERAARCEDFIQYWSREIWGDPNDLFRPSARLVRDGPFRAVICGHSHLPGLVDLGEGHYVNAGSWTYGSGETASWDGAELAVEDVGSGRHIGDERYRWMLDGVDPGDIFNWWARNYLGRLRFRRRPEAGNRKGEPTVELL